MSNFEFINETPFASEQFVIPDENGRENLVIVTKATYTFTNDNMLIIDEEQTPIIPAPEYYGKPGESSLKFDSEAVLEKLSTDIAIIGHAYPKKKGDTHVDIMVKVGPLKKIARVFGDRQWSKFMGIKKISKPLPFEKMPLLYEKAYGGLDTTHKNPKKHAAELANPIGTGYGKIEEGMALPNIEDPYNLIENGKKPKPIGFGFIAPDWQPRVNYVGTYDDEWKKSRMPLLPLDFDKKFYNAAHPDLTAIGYLKGNEPVELYFISPEKKNCFNLPGEKKPEVEVIMKSGKKEKLAINLDTVIINTNERKVSLIWRGKTDIYNKVYDVRTTIVHF